MNDILKETETHQKGKLKFISFTWIQEPKNASLIDKESTFKMIIFSKEDIESAINKLEEILISHSK